ncbi:hypothetical protein PFISCL1PPCAC_18783, partial [Pristionchus fissidentatus]
RAMSEADFFEGKVAIVTGSSSGIGRETAKLLAVRGAKVLLVGRLDAIVATDSVEDATSELLSAGVKEDCIHSIVINLCDAGAPKAIVAAAVDRFGRLDILVNSAGFVSTDVTVKGVECSIEHFDRMMDIHCKAVVLMVQEATPHLELTKGAIVNVSSVTALPFMNQIHAYYAAAKAAQDHLTIQMAGHLIKKGIRVNSVLPGIAATNIAANSGFKSVSNALDKFLATPGAIPAGRIATANDIAKAIVFLADGSQSSYVVGKTFL